MLPQAGEDISKRDREILRTIVQDFISSGEPVGSQAIAPRCELSSATIRSAMADLEELGYLAKPHTSAGRIPTDKAFRLYVDSLLRVRSPTAKDLERIERGVQPAPLSDLIADTGRMLHELTHHASVVLAPQFDQTIFRRIEFVQLRDDRILAIFVSQAGHVQNRLITVDFPVGPSELLHATNYLNELLGELSLEQIHARLRGEREADQALYDELRRKALDLAQKAFADQDLPEPEVLIEGEASFLDDPSFAADVAKMRRLFAALSEKDRLLHVLRRAIEGREIRIFIGAESEFSGAAGVSLIAAPYTQGERVLGALAIIGPTRMNYGRVIPLVQHTARAVSRALADS